ncbi:MAG: C45 family autoproteolytic acyltransferase/hydrolase [Candidatus Krumholzibacteria bacterium]|nr:C45 family autoproteolytic acyltransferase/hydrolase [Candidatus Krumholzibacteria bacterium]
MNGYSRREFLGQCCAAAAGAVLLPLAGCGSRHEGVLDVPPIGYPTVAASGSHYEIGRTIGTAMRGRILGHLRYAADFRDSVAYLEGEGARTLERMLSRSREAFPHLIEEMAGMAEALEIPFMHLFAFNCRSEIEIMRNPPGCSTIAISDGDRTILAHNEDGSDLNIGRMFLARVSPPGGVSFLAFVYPGLLPGNGPAVNSRGIVETTNYIQPYRVADGIPRYLISRAILEAKDLDEAVGLATMSPRAFPFHHNLVSLGEGRILSVETAAWPEQRSDVIEVRGLYIHTNHFLHPEMSGPGPDGKRPFDIPYVSSTTRLDVLARAVESGGEPSNEKGILDLLALHEGRPYSPCRHPEGNVRGATLGTAVFTAPGRRMVLYHGNPCKHLRKEHAL